MMSSKASQMSDYLIKRDCPRKIVITPNINPYADGSVIIEFGNTKVHITVSITEEVPPFLKGKSKGWLTAEYNMLPMATHSRNQRERKSLSGRSQEIQRLIGRALRGSVNLELIGERTIVIDCDVLVADGGTRTASISGAYVALSIAIEKLIQNKKIEKNPLLEQIAAVSVGLKGNEIYADLNYDEDSSFDSDINLVMTKSGKILEIQGTAEKKEGAFDKMALIKIIECGENALKDIFKAQTQVLSSL